MQLPAARLTGANKFRRYYWFGAFVLLTMLVIFAVSKRDKNVISNTNAAIIQQHNRVISIKAYDTAMMMEQKRIAVSPTVTKLQATQQNITNKSNTDKLVLSNNKLQDKLIDDSILNHQNITNSKVLNQSKRNDTLSISKEAILQTGIQQANINVKKMDSVTMKSEIKKEAPYIIW